MDEQPPTSANSGRRMHAVDVAAFPVLSDDEEEGRLSADHDYRAVFVVRPREGKDPATDGPDAYCPPCPRCNCRYTTQREWNPPSGECPASVLAVQVATTTDMRDPSSWSQYIVCMLCNLCGVGAQEKQPCPSGTLCNGHFLNEFVCTHAPDVNGPACSRCQRAGKDRPCPCNICICARKNNGTHPKTWRLRSSANIKQRVAKTRNKETLARQLSAVSVASVAKGVNSRHVHGVLAQAIIGGARVPAALPDELRSLVDGVSGTGASSPGSESGTWVCLLRACMPDCACVEPQPNLARSRRSA